MEAPTLNDTSMGMKLLIGGAVGLVLWKIYSAPRVAAEEQARAVVPGALKGKAKGVEKPTTVLDDHALSNSLPIGKSGDVKYELLHPKDVHAAEMRYAKIGK